MILLILKRQNTQIDLLVNDNLDMSIITENLSLLFEIDTLYKTALKNFMQDYTAEFAKYTDLINMLKSQDIIGFPVTPMKDARLYALDRQISINYELEIACNEI
jgi:hypothetical protein